MRSRQCRRKSFPNGRLKACVERIPRGERRCNAPLPTLTSLHSFELGSGAVVRPDKQVKRQHGTHEEPIF